MGLTWRSRIDAPRRSRFLFGFAVVPMSAFLRSYGPLLCGVCVWLLALVPARPAEAQKFGRIEETQTNTAYFYYAQPGEATIQIYVWGSAQPGIYEIPDSTSLSRLLTMTGGVPRGQRQENEEPARIEVRLYRPEASRETPVLDTRARRVLEGTVEAPTLQENDILVVETIRQTQFTWRDGVSLTSTALSLTLLILRLLDRR